MSGEKRTYVSVEDRELRRLREQESRLRSLNQDLPERLDAVRRQAEKEMHDRLAPIEKRQREYESTVNNLQSELGNLERETQKRLVRQQKEFTGRLDSQRGEYLSLIKEQDQRHTAMVEDEKRARQQAVNNLQGQITNIVDGANRKMDFARSFVVDLTKILEETDLLPHQRFAPGGMDKVSRHVDDARQNLKSESADAALSTAQTAYWKLADLRADVIAKEQEFMLVHQAAIQAARELLEEARSNRKHQLEVGEGMDRSVHELEVDHWTRGELSTFEKELRDLEKRLIDGKETLTIKEARQILEDLDAMKSRSMEIVEHARQNILASQVRCNIAELAAEALNPEGFDIVDAAYAGGDERNAYVVKVRNIAGSEVVTVITPVDGEYGKNEISIHSHDKTFVDESVLMQRSCEIVEVLKGQGLLAGTPQCMGDADQSCFDLDAVRRNGLKKTRTSSASAKV